MVAMTCRRAGDWIAGVTMAAVLVAPCAAAAGQTFALDEQVRPRDESARERERERAEQARERFENFYEQGQNAIERAEWQRAVERFTVCLLYTSPSPRDS